MAKRARSEDDMVESPPGQESKDQAAIPEGGTAVVQERSEGGSCHKWQPSPRG